MNNPISRNPHHALFPRPEGCSGNRLWKMLNETCGARMSDYVEVFDRRNLLATATWDQAQARDAASDFLNKLPDGAQVLVLGEKPREALGLEKLLLHPQVVQLGMARRVTFRQLPHPSGRSHWYNEPDHRLIAGLLLEELYERGRMTCET